MALVSSLMLLSTTALRQREASEHTDGSSADILFVDGGDDNTPDAGKERLSCTKAFNDLKIPREANVRLLIQDSTTGNKLLVLLLPKGGDKHTVFVDNYVMIIFWKTMPKSAQEFQKFIVSATVAVALQLHSEVREVEFLTPGCFEGNRLYTILRVSMIRGRLVEL